MGARAPQWKATVSAALFLGALWTGLGSVSRLSAEAKKAAVYVATSDFDWYSLADGVSEVIEMGITFVDQEGTVGGWGFELELNNNWGVSEQTRWVQYCQEYDIARTALIRFYNESQIYGLNAAMAGKRACEFAKSRGHSKVLLQIPKTYVLDFTGKDGMYNFFTQFEKGCGSLSRIGAIFQMRDFLKNPSQVVLQLGQGFQRFYDYWEVELENLTWDAVPGTSLSDKFSYLYGQAPVWIAGFSRGRPLFNLERLGKFMATQNSSQPESFPDSLPGTKEESRSAYIIEGLNGLQKYAASRRENKAMLPGMAFGPLLGNQDDEFNTYVQAMNALLETAYVESKIFTQSCLRSIGGDPYKRMVCRAACEYTDLGTGPSLPLAWPYSVDECTWATAISRPETVLRVEEMEMSPLL